MSEPPAVIIAEHSSPAMASYISTLQAQLHEALVRNAHLDQTNSDLQHLIHNQATSQLNRLESLELSFTVLVKQFGLDPVTLEAIQTGQSTAVFSKKRRRTSAKHSATTEPISPPPTTAATSPSLNVHIVPHVDVPGEEGGAKPTAKVVNPAAVPDSEPKTTNQFPCTILSCSKTYASKHTLSSHFQQRHATPVHVEFAVSGLRVAVHRSAEPEGILTCPACEKCRVVTMHVLRDHAKTCAGGLLSVVEGGVAGTVTVGAVEAHDENRMGTECSGDGIVDGLESV
ncbi:hypothetical protein HDU98_006711 [Podochytrium sp. JEL0797]|nr:hypothetical protein HDU98_006711 [Podochytrium sp. JEL0797]